jgi:hypothetical protein
MNSKTQQEQTERTETERKTPFLRLLATCRSYLLFNPFVRPGGGNLRPATAIEISTLFFMFPQTTIRTPAFAKALAGGQNLIATTLDDVMVS